MTGVPTFAKVTRGRDDRTALVSASAGGVHLSSEDVELTPSQARALAYDLMASALHPEDPSAKASWEVPTRAEALALDAIRDGWAMYPRDGVALHAATPRRAVVDMVVAKGWAKFEERPDVRMVWLTTAGRYAFARAVTENIV